MLAEYGRRLWEFGQTLDVRMAECLRPEVRQQRWRATVRRQQAEDKVLRMICRDHPPEKVITGWGSAFCRGSTQLRDLAVQRGVKVVLVDEYNTSKLCSACLSRLEGFPHRRRRDSTGGGEEAVRRTTDNRRGKRGGSAPSRQRRRRRYLAQRGQTYERRWCRNEECPRVAWDRDVNASINILRLLVDMLLGRPRNPAFCRPTAGKCSFSQRQQVLFGSGKVLIPRCPISFSCHQMVHRGQEARRARVDRASYQYQQCPETQSRAVASWR